MIDTVSHLTRRSEAFHVAETSKPIIITTIIWNCSTVRPESDPVPKKWTFTKLWRETRYNHCYLKPSQITIKPDLLRKTERGWLQNLPQKRIIAIVLWNCFGLDLNLACIERMWTTVIMTIVVWNCLKLDLNLIRFTTGELQCSRNAGTKRAVVIIIWNHLWLYLNPIRPWTGEPERSRNAGTESVVWKTRSKPEEQRICQPITIVKI